MKTQYESMKIDVHSESNSRFFINAIRPLKLGGICGAFGGRRRTQSDL